MGMNRSDIIGHAPLIDYFERIVGNGMFGSAYFFVGPPQVGKRAVAEWLIELVRPGECIRIENDTSEGHTSIGIQQIRDMIRSLSQTSLQSGPRIILIDGAHRLTDEAANALLKTLEEPPKNIHFILIAPDRATVLPTIFSRCCVLRFLPVPSKIITHALEVRGVSDAGLLAEYSYGSPGRALAWIKEDGIVTPRLVHEQYTALKSLSLANRLLTVEKEKNSFWDAAQVSLHTACAVASGDTAPFLAQRYEQLKATTPLASFRTSREQGMDELFLDDVVV